ncbi:MAG: hypothetical protein Q3988_06630 [Gemella sp.]|nr:hypothetical protein [Gemella sp.]
MAKKGSNRREFIINTNTEIDPALRMFIERNSNVISWSPLRVEVKEGRTITPLLNVLEENRVEVTSVEEKQN